MSLQKQMRRYDGQPTGASHTTRNGCKLARLELLKIPYEVKKWVSGSGAKGVEGPEYTKINPFGRTPALEDKNTGILISESGAVLEYILRTYDREHSAGPAREGQDKATFDEWNQVLLTGLAPAMGELAYFRGADQPDAAAHFRSEVHRILVILEAHLKKATKFIVSDKFSVVDINFYPWLNLYDFLGLDIGPYPNVGQWLAQCKSVPEVAAGLASIERGHSRPEK